MKQYTYSWLVAMAALTHQKYFYPPGEPVSRKCCSKFVHRTKRQPGKAYGTKPARVQKAFGPNFQACGVVFGFVLCREGTRLELDIGYIMILQGAMSHKIENEHRVT